MNKYLEEKRDELKLFYVDTNAQVCHSKGFNDAMALVKAEIKPVLLSYGGFRPHAKATDTDHMEHVPPLADFGVSARDIIKKWFGND